MPEFQSIGAFERHVDRFLGELSVDMLKRAGRTMGRQAVRIATEEASRDLGGDPKFSGWAPMLEVRAVEVKPGVVSVRPTKRSAGPWTVANDGRHQGNAGGFAGPGVNRATGQTARTKAGAVRKTRASKRRRWNGTTKGKGTADRAVARMEPMVETVAQVELTKTLVKFFD